MRDAFEAAGGAFAPVYVAFGWVHRAAHILGQVERSGTVVRAQLSGLLGAMRRHRKSVGELGDAVDQFVKVSRCYWLGLFACYDTARRPRTNNDLERAFGSHRYHERRATGHKGASPALVLRGAAKLVAGLATRHGRSRPPTWRVRIVWRGRGCGPSWKHDASGGSNGGGSDVTPMVT